MNKTDKIIPFRVINWDQIMKIRHEGTTGFTHWQTMQFQGLRIRIVEYSPGYLADHWCKKGHIVHCLEGEFVSEMEDGQAFVLSKGMTYVVYDNMSSHRSKTKDGVRLLIIDGDFLNPEI
ncbi:MAG TPA: DHCW motif cupin fold protein [Bacteroidales bacterium]|nr:DHCW motif cupin fold protein [Bacteroidales bacterium]